MERLGPTGADQRGVAGPRPGRQRRHARDRSGLERVPVHVPDQRQEIAVVVDPAHAVAGLEHVAGTAIAIVEVAAERGPDALHHARERLRSGPHDEMQVVRLHGPCEAAGALLRQYPGEGVEAGAAVAIVQEEIAPIDASDEHVMNRSRGVDARSARHGESPRDRGVPRGKQRGLRRARRREVDVSTRPLS